MSQRGKVFGEPGHGLAPERAQSAELAGGAPVASAAPGDALAVITPIAGCQGIGVAFDGTSILFTCADDPVVHKTDLTGADLGGVAITGIPAGSAGTGLDAIA